MKQGHDDVMGKATRKGKTHETWNDETGMVRFKGISHRKVKGFLTDRK